MGNGAAMFHVLVGLLFVIIGVVNVAFGVSRF